MKTLKRIILNHLETLVSMLLPDPLQFTLRPGIEGVTYITVMPKNTGNNVRVMFFDFSSSFNTIQQALLR